MRGTEHPSCSFGLPQMISNDSNCPRPQWSNCVQPRMLRSSRALSRVVRLQAHVTFGGTPPYRTGSLDSSWHSLHALALSFLHRYAGDKNGKGGILNLAGISRVMLHTCPGHTSWSMHLSLEKNTAVVRVSLQGTILHKEFRPWHKCAMLKTRTVHVRAGIKALGGFRNSHSLGPFETSYD